MKQNIINLDKPPTEEDLKMEPSKIRISIITVQRKGLLRNETDEEIQGLHSLP